MSIIDTIERTFEGITIPVNDTDFHIRLIGGTVKNIILIHRTADMYAAQLDVRVFAHKVDELITIAKILKTRPYIAIEFLDKHTFRTMDRFKQTAMEDYYFIQKESLTEIKGGSYAADQSIDKLQATLSDIKGHKYE